MERELREVTDYNSLGIQLGIEPSILKLLEANYQDSERRRREVIDLWLRKVNDPSWTNLAKAVEDMGGHDRLAQHLRLKAEEGKKCFILHDHVCVYSLVPAFSGDSCY